MDCRSSHSLKQFVDQGWCFSSCGAARDFVSRPVRPSATMKALRLAQVVHRALCRFWNGATVITSTETI
jgi:hypothetical protein